MKRIAIVLLVLCTFGLAMAQTSAGVQCIYDSECGTGYFCKKDICNCQGFGVCAPKSTGGICLQVWIPVCGCDGRTYSNSCFAGLANVNIAYQGECFGGGGCGCIDSDHDGAYANCPPWDCNDYNESINPGATEICDGLDNNCNQFLDEGFDNDGDGMTTCVGDCNDANPTVYFGAPEIVADGIDQDCNLYDLTISVTQAVYARKSRTLTVTATSARGSEAALEVVSYGSMLWNLKKKIWTFSQPGLTAAPAEVIVQGPEGAVAKEVTVR